MSLVTVTWAWAKEGNSFASAGHMSQLMSSKRTAKERQPRAATCQQECTPIVQSWRGKPWETPYNFGSMWKGDAKSLLLKTDAVVIPNLWHLSRLSGCLRFNVNSSQKWGYPFNQDTLLPFWGVGLIFYRTCIQFPCTNDSHILHSQSSYM